MVLGRECTCREGNGQKSLICAKPILAPISGCTGSQVHDEYKRLRQMSPQAPSSHTVKLFLFRAVAMQLSCISRYLGIHFPIPYTYKASDEQSAARTEVLVVLQFMLKFVPEFAGTVPPYNVSLPQKHAYK